MSRTHGFSLIELIMIIVLLSVGLVGLMAMFGRSVGSIDSNVAFQTGAQAVQQCAEHLLGVRRRVTNGYDVVSASSCDTLGMPAGYTRALTVTSPYTGSACPVVTLPATVSCKRVQIVVSRTGFGQVAQGDLALVNSF